MKTTPAPRVRLRPAGALELWPSLHMSCHPRPDQQAHTKEYFTAAERERAGISYGTVKQQLGTDSQIKFDQCNVCLGPLVDAVASPAGYLYCRECIYKNLLAQKQALEEQRRLFAEEQAAAADDAAAAQSQRQSADLLAFERQETGPERVVPGGSNTANSAASTPGSAGAAAIRGTAAATGGVAAAAAAASTPTATSAASAAAGPGGGDSSIISALGQRVDLRTKREIIAEATASSFWVVGATPAAPVRAKAPDPAPRDPMAGTFLRAKQLLTLKLSRSAEAGDAAGASSSASAGGAGTASAATAAATAAQLGSAGGDRSTRWMCPVCRKGVVFQKMFALRGCGHVLCEPCVKRFVSPSKQCAVCSTPVPTAGDAIGLQQAGSSFAANKGTQSVATVYKPAMM